MRHISSRTIYACRQRLSQLREGQRDTGLPVDVSALARQLGVRIIEPACLNVDGYVGLTENGAFVIRYRRANSVERDRFTIAHEIGHLLIAEVTGIPITAEKMRTGYDYEESAANQLAAEVLMPADVLRIQLRGLNPSWGSVQQLRKLFKVSAHALLRRITEIEGMAAVFATFDFDGGGIQKWGFCNATAAPQVSFDSPFREIVRTQLHCAHRCTFVAAAYVGDSRIRIPCEMRIARSSEAMNSWVFGWAFY